MRLQAIDPALQDLAIFRILPSVHRRKVFIGQHTLLDFQEFGFWHAKFDELLDRRLHPAKAAAFATQIEIQEGRVRNAEMFQ